MNRVTVAVSADPDLIKGANHVHVLLSKADGFDTYVDPTWQDVEGHLYCVSSGIWSDVQILSITNPEIFTEVIKDIMSIFPDLDLAIVSKAQAAFVWNEVATPGKIVAIINDDPQAALMELGLVSIL